MDRLFGPNWSELKGLSIEKVVMGDAAFFEEGFRGAILLHELIFSRFVEIFAYLRCQYNFHKNIVITTGSSVVLQSRR